MDNRNNRLFLDTLEALREKGLSEEEAIKAYEDAYSKFDEINTPKEKYSTASKYGTPRETLKRQTILGNVKRGSPLNLTDYDAGIQTKAARIRALKNIGKYGLAPLATALSAKDAYENFEEGNYADAAVDATGVLSGAAASVFPPAALPLAIPSIAKMGAKAADAYAWNRIPESVQKGGVSALSSSLEKTAEDTPEAEERRKVLKEKFNLNVVPKKDRPIKLPPAKAFTDSEIENLSNPEMVEKEKREKIVKDAIEMSKMNNKNYSDVQHQMVGVQALENYDKGNKLKQNLGELKENVGEFFSGLFKKDPEDIQKAKAEEREKYLKLNQQRIAAGLSPIEIPAGLEEKKHTRTAEDEKKYEFKTKQLAATPDKSSGLSEEGLKFDDLLKQYANYDYKNNLQGVSDEELNELAKGRGEKRNISYIAQTPEGYKGPSPEEVKAEAINVAKKLNQNPAMFLGQVDQESSFNPLAISKTGAKGLGQMFPDAYTDAKKMDKDGILKNIPYREMIKPENWKLQLYAAGLYNSWIDKYMTKGAGDEARLKWYSGGGDEEKAKAKGTDPSAYAKAVFRRAKKFEKELGEQIPTAEVTNENAPKSVARNPAGVIDEESEEGEIVPQVTDRTSLDKIQKLKSIQSFLKGETSDTPISFGPYSDTEAGRNLYSRGIKDQNRLLTLKNKYDQMMADKDKNDQMMMDKGKNPSGESINFVPVEGEDGKPINFVPVEGPDGQAMPSPVPQAEEQKNIELKLAEDAANQMSPEQAQVNALVNQARQESDFAKKLKEAEEQAEDTRRLAGILKGAERIMSGAAGLASKSYIEPPKVSAFEDLEQSANLPLEKLKRGLEMQKEDPNSEVSKDMRGLVNEELRQANLKMDLTGLSYNQLKDIFPSISRQADRLQAQREKKETKDELKEEKKEAKTKDDQNNFLDNARKTFTKEESMNHYLTVKNAVDQIDDYMKNPNPIKAKSLGYLFATVSDPKSVVRESEIKLFGSAGGILDKIHNEAKLMMSGTYSTKKANDFKDFVQQKLQGYQSNLESKVSGYIKGGERYGIKEQDVVENILGPPFWEGIYKKKAIQDTADKSFKGDIDKATAFLKQRGDIQ
jgi:hypothetical protein